MTLVGPSTRTCTCVPLRTFECPTSSLRSFLDCSSRAQHRWGQICALRVLNSQERGTRDARAESEEYETGRLLRSSDYRPFPCCAKRIGANPTAAERGPGHMVRIPAEAIQSEQFRLRSLA